MTQVKLVSGSTVVNGSLVPFSEIPPGIGFLVRSERGGMSVADRFYLGRDGRLHTTDPMGNVTGLARHVPSPDAIVTLHVPTY